MFPSEKIVFLPSVEKTTIFSSGNKSSPQSFSVPGIKFPPRRNIYTSQVFILASDLYTTYFDDFKNLERTGIVLLFLDFMARRVFKTKEPEESLKI